MTAAQHKKLAFAWIAANIILIPHIRPVEGTASLYTDLILGLSGLPLCWWVWRDRHETLTYHFAWETPLLTLILLIFLTLPALRDLIGSSQTLTPHWYYTDRNARMPDHYYLELFAKPLATVPTASLATAVANAHPPSVSNTGHTAAPSNTLISRRPHERSPL